MITLFHFSYKVSDVQIRRWSPKGVWIFWVRVSQKTSKVKLLSPGSLHEKKKKKKVLVFTQESAFDIMRNESAICYFGPTFKGFQGSLGFGFYAVDTRFKVLDSNFFLSVRLELRGRYFWSSFCECALVVGETCEYIQGHPMDLFLKKSVHQANFLLAGFFRKINVPFGGNHLIDGEQVFGK